MSPGICNFGPGIQGCCNQGVRRRNDEGWVHVICPISNASARPRASFFCLFRPPRCTPSLAHDTQKRTCAAVYVSIVDETVVESKPKSTFVFLIHGPHQNGFKKLNKSVRLPDHWASGSLGFGLCCCKITGEFRPDRCISWPQAATKTDARHSLTEKQRPS